MAFSDDWLMLDFSVCVSIRDSMMFKMPSGIYAGGEPIKAIRASAKKTLCQNPLFGR
jgi:hypothetical protein